MVSPVHQRIMVLAIGAALFERSWGMGILSSEPDVARFLTLLSVVLIADP